MIKNALGKIDEYIALISPGFALKRAQARHMLASYEAAKPGRNRRKRGESRGPNVVANESIESLRAQARYLDENYDIVTGSLDTLVMRTVGPAGIMVEPMAKTKDGDLHDDFNRKINDLFSEYWEEPEVSGELSGAQAEQLAARSFLRDGEMFTQIVEGEKPGLKYATGIPFSIELLEPDLVPLNFDDSGKRIFQGISKNAWNRSTGYYVYKSHPNDYQWRLPGFEDLRPISGDNMLHVKLIKRIGQTRGVSLLHSVIIRIEDLKDYEESERIAARIAAAAAFYIRKGSPDTFIPDPEGDTTERSFKVSPGMVFDRLEPGEEIGSIQSNRPSALLEPFRNAMVKAYSSGMKISYSSASKDYNGTYSAQRQELVEQWDHYTTLQKYFSSRFKSPIYKRFVRMAILSGRIDVPKDVDQNSIYKAHYQGPAMPWIDPDKESKANERNNRAGFNSRSAIIRSRNENPMEVEQQLAIERSREKRLGLFLTSNAENDKPQESETEKGAENAEE